MNIKKPILLILSAIFIFSCGNLQKIDRSSAPIPGPAPKINIGDYKKFTLDNGLQIIFVEDHKVPQVSYQLDLDINPVLEGNKVGISALAGRLMRSGTVNHTKSEIDEQIDYIGGWISTAANGMSASSLTKHSDVLLQLMSDILLNPTFPEEELAKEKQAELSGLAAESTDAGAISNRMVNLINYGENHPYGEYETETTIKNITQADLINYYQTYYRPNVAYLIIVGDLSQEEAKANAIKYFGEWEPAEVPKTTYDLPVSPKKNRVVLVPMEGAVQSVIKITYPVDIKPGGVDNVAATLMNKVLGGTGFSSRLMQNIREDKAYTYGAYSSLYKDQIIGEFSASANVRNEVTDSAVTEFLYEMERMTTSLIADSTLRLMKNNSLGKIALSLEDPQTVAEFALNIEKYKLPNDFYDTYLTKLENTTKEQILASAKKYISPKNCNIIITGNAEEIEESLLKFSNDGKIEIVDEYGKPWAGRKKVPQGVTLQSVFDRYIAVSGGKEVLEKINTFRQVGKMAVQGMVLDMVVEKKNKDKVLINITMGGNSMMKQIINGDVGVRIQMGTKEPLESLEILTTKVQANLLGCLQYEYYSLEAKLVGMEVINQETFFVVEVYNDNALQFTDYYSVDSGFKIISKLMVETPQGELEATSRYGGFKDFDGAILPAVVEQRVGPQTMTFTINTMEQNVTLDDSLFDIH